MADAYRSPLRLGTRASPLAMAQAHMVRDALCLAHGWEDDSIILCPVTATGDRIQDRALADLGGKALWTRELDVALAANEIDFAVHSMKDVETERPDDFCLAATLPRADVRDRLVGAASIEAIASGARFGTSAPRRRAQLLALRPDIESVLLRGNVATRLAKVKSGEVDATLLAAAGLERLGLHAIGVPLPIETLLPAPQQGVVGVECRASDSALRALLLAIDHGETHKALSAERALLAALGGGCRSPVAALAVSQGDMLWLRARLYSADGQEQVEGEVRFAPENDSAPTALARQLLGAASPAIRSLFG